MNSDPHAERPLRGGTQRPTHALKSLTSLARRGRALIKVEEVMTAPVLTVDEQTTVLEAGRIMGRRHVGSLIVTRQGKPVGILTERDLLSKAFGKGLAPGRVRVKRLMSSPLTVVHPDRELKEAARIMAQLHIRRLPVLQNGQLVGIVTAADIVAALARAPLAV